jgi:ribonuclease D
VSKTGNIKLELRHITREKDFDKVISKLRQANFIAVDLEFDSNHHHYGFKLCLMQIFCGNTVYLIDPQYVDIKRIFPFLEDESIEKIVFSFGEDLKLLHSLNCNPKNIYDISVAVKLLNYDKISLSDVVEKHLGITLEKGSQKSDWCRRPFSEKQKIYAANDVLYLPQIADLIKNETRRKGIENWIDEENKALEKSGAGGENKNSIKNKDGRNMTLTQWNFYRQLWNFREEKAKILDKPPHQVIDNNFLKEIAVNPSLLNNWAKNKFIHRALKNVETGRYLKKLYEDTKKNAKKDAIPEDEPAFKRPSKDEVRKNREKRNQAEKIKEEIFKPVQAAIRYDYGENAVTFILSNKLMDELIRGDKTNLRNYKRELFLKYSEKIGKYL